MNIFPNYIDGYNFKYIKLDNKLILSVIIADYPKYCDFMQVMESMPKDIEYDFSMFVNKLDTKEVLKQITSNITLAVSELKTVNKNQQDIDILSITKSDAEKLRYDIQINNQEIYNIYCYLSIYVENVEKPYEILSIFKKIESKLYSKQIISYAANFRQVEAYLATLPLNVIRKELKDNYRNFTTSALVNLFPFYSTNIFDLNGVIFGHNYIDNQIFNIDIFDTKYNNANVCVFGSSGSGKSFFIKLHIIRQYFIAKQQYVFDLEGEYVNLAKNLGQAYIQFNSSGNRYYNILDITYEESKCVNFLNNKVSKISKFFSNIINLNENQEDILKEATIQAYNSKSIFENDESSLYIYEENDNVLLKRKFKASKYMPILEEIYECIKNLKKVYKSKEDKASITKLIELFKSKVLEQYPYLNKSTNIDLKASLIVIDLRKSDLILARNLLIFFIDLLKLKFNENIDNSNNSKEININSIIYIDEVWKYIYKDENAHLSAIILDLYKTVRKLKASIVTITQDISDFFEYENGNFGKVVLNNSSFKLFFKLDYADTKVLNKIAALEINQIDQISKLDKAQMYLGIKNSYVKLNVKASEFEKSVIEGRYKSEDSCSNR